ncbi:COP9 signalosome (CSN) subunit [Coemansia helicoidea]|uniref:COP9 signalosome (CSN) subunit n=1 Tax=Coemansia helicoidea TaxID=1286919 RepID=A0ACC1L6M5_9FUNG|nr:COP9 signalosome (CSN) subunit [Coemansia helicoidea]
MSSSERLSRAQQKFKILASTKNGDELAAVLPLNSEYTNLVLGDMLKEDGGWDALREPLSRGLWNEVTVEHFRAAIACRRGDFVEACARQLATYHAFLRAFRHMERWSINGLLVLCRDLCSVAQRADALLAGDGQGGKVEEATRAINQGFSLCMTDREPDLAKSRKWGTYRVANILFRLYRRLGAHNLCDSMIRAIKASELPELDAFPMSDQVTFRFYRGMLAFRSESYAQAKDDLLFALAHCHRDAYANKIRILTYLTPVLMAEGAMPQSRLMRRYPPVKALYGELAKAARAGNLRRFDELLAEKEQQLVAAGAFLAAERVRRIATRELLRKLYLIGGSASRVPFQMLRDGFVAAGLADTSVPEIEAILADTIYGGYVKGYLAHDHGVAVLSKQEPFPPLRSLVQGS